MAIFRAMNSRLLLCVLAWCSCSIVFAAQAVQVAPVERPGDGKPVCGLGASFHSGRRAALREKLGQGVVVVRGLPDTRDYTRFHQDKVFWYLTGIETPNAAFAMDCASGREVLFLPEKNAFGEQWEGEVWDSGDAWVKELAGFAEVRTIKDLDSVLGELVGTAPQLWISMHPHIALSGCFDRAQPDDYRRKKDAFDGRVSREQAFKDALQAKYEVEPKDLSPKLSELRRVKTSEEIAAMRRASVSGALAMAEAIRSTHAGLGEWDLDALMSWWQVREGASGPAYHAIVGSGPNSLTLHYSASSRRLQDGEVILIDYAPEVDHYVSDVTRTWPVNGKFSARQAELYDAVLAAQLAGIAAVKPGVRLGDIERACAQVIDQRGFAALKRHGACHYIGLEVHDVGRGADLVPGVCFTIEPGLYEEATNIGIRIEDVVCVTETGCEVLSAGVPKERGAIEQLVQQDGVLDWLAKRQAAR